MLNELILVIYLDSIWYYTQHRLLQNTAIVIMTEFWRILWPNYFHTIFSDSPHFPPLPPCRVECPLSSSLFWHWFQNSSWCSIPRNLLIYPLVFELQLPVLAVSYVYVCMYLWDSLRGWKHPRRKLLAVHITNSFSLLPNICYLLFQQCPRFLLWHRLLPRT